jgi:hypothetical protein
LLFFLIASRTIPSQSVTEAGTARKRVQRACTQCHSHKTKCSGDLPKCKRCETSDLVCEYAPGRRRFSNIPATTETDADASASVLSHLPDSRSQSIGDLSNSVSGIPGLPSLIREYGRVPILTLCSPLLLPLDDGRRADLGASQESDGKKRPFAHARRCLL